MPKPTAPTFFAASMPATIRPGASQSSRSAPARRSRFSFSVLLIALAAVLMPASSAWAEGGIDLGLGLGFSITDGDSSTNVSAVSLRAHHWLSDRWGIEGALSVTDEGVFHEDNRYLDLSALYRVSENPRFSTFLFGGVGALEYRAQEFSRDDNGFPTVIDLGDDTVATIHVGVGFQINLTERFHFRPDLRHRRHLDVVDDSDDRSFDATVGFGWKF